MAAPSGLLKLDIGHGLGYIVVLRFERFKTSYGRGKKDRQALLDKLCLSELPIGLFYRTFVLI